jgi:formylmethanofuran dehydrogenase subunit B
MPSSEAADSPEPLRIIDDAVCAACGSTCDDIRLSVAGDTVVEARRACNLGRTWFTRPAAIGLAATVDGRESSLEAALTRAANMLAGARYPLVYGLTHATSEAQRAAAGLADGIGGVIDTPSSRVGPIGSALHAVGKASCTLGTVTQRGELLVYWGADPVRTHPRHLTRYTLTPEGRFIDGGRRGRHVIVIDDRDNNTADVADEFVRIKPGTHFEALWTVRAIVGGIELDADEVEDSTGVPLKIWQRLAGVFRRDEERRRGDRHPRYGVLLYGDGLTRGSAGRVNVEAALGLVHDLNAFGRFSVRSLGNRGNTTGSENVLTWRTGYPASVDFARGFPRYQPEESVGPKLVERREVDAAVLVGCDAEMFTPELVERLNKIPTIVIGPEVEIAGLRPTVCIRTARYGLETTGTTYRPDEVPLELRPLRESSFPQAEEVLKRLEAESGHLAADGKRRNVK